jgi:hypothetical protein
MNCPTGTVIIVLDVCIIAQIMLDEIYSHSKSHFLDAEFKYFALISVSNFR